MSRSVSHVCSVSCYLGATVGGGFSLFSPWLTKRTTPLFWEVPVILGKPLSLITSWHYLCSQPWCVIPLWVWFCDRICLLFFLWDCEEKQTLIFSISSVPSLCLTFIFLGSVVVLFISTRVQSSSSWLLAQSQVSSCPCPIKRYTSPSPLAEQPFPSAPVLALHGGIHIRGRRSR